MRLFEVTHHIDSQFTEIGVQLTGESETGGDSGHGGANEVVEVTIGGGGEFEGAETDVVKSFVIDTISLISVLNKLMDGEGSIVGLDNGVRHLKVQKVNFPYRDEFLAQSIFKLNLTLGEGTTEKVFMMRSGYSSRILEMRRVPIPDPVPPPREWVSWNP